MPSFRGQLLSGMGAQAYQRGVTIATQLLVLPIMLRSWGAEVYGGWLALDSLRRVFALTDFGLAQIAANEVTQLIAAGKRRRARVVSSSAWMMLVLAVLLVLGLSALIAVLVPLADLLNITSNRDEVGPTFFLLSLVACNQLLFGVVGAGLRAVGLYWLMVCTNATYQLGMGVALAAWGILGGSYLDVAVTVVLWQAALFVATGSFLMWRHPWTRPLGRLMSLAQVRRMLAPSFAYMLFYLTNLATIQGVNVLVAGTLGTTAVTVVSAIRTLTRIGRMFASIVIFSLEPIFAQLKGRGDADGGRRVYRNLVVTGLIGAGTYCAGMLLLGPAFLEWWTDGVVVGYDLLHGLMTLAITLEILWFTLQTPYVSTNRHAVFAYAVAAFGLVSTLLAWPLLGMIGLPAAGWTLMGMHAGVLAYTIWRIRTHPPFDPADTAPASTA